jgi:hypothetical protein
LNKPADADPKFPGREAAGVKRQGGDIKDGAVEGDLVAIEVEGFVSEMGVNDMDRIPQIVVEAGKGEHSRRLVRVHRSRYVM